MSIEKKYEIRIYIEGMPGYFTYSVNSKIRAMMHFGEIARGGYRRYDSENDRFVWYSPKRIWEINIIGSDLGSNYPDTFKRT